MTDHQHHVTVDTQLDAVALSGALLREDAEAVNAVLTHTGCGQCLALAAMQWGHALATWAGGDTAATDGRPAGTPQFRARMEQVIADAQRQVTAGTYNL